MLDFQYHFPHSTLLFTLSSIIIFFFFFNDTATTEIYTLSLHDALPISVPAAVNSSSLSNLATAKVLQSFADVTEGTLGDRKSTRLNSSHGYISYAVFCLKKKKNSIMNRNSLF